MHSGQADGPGPGKAGIIPAPAVRKPYTRTTGPFRDSRRARLVGTYVKGSPAAPMVTRLSAAQAGGEKRRIIARATMSSR